MPASRRLLLLRYICGRLMKRATSTRKTEPRARRGAPRRMGSAPPVPVHLERSLEEFLHRQVYRELAQLICARRLRPGARLPSSRALAEELGVSRNTVLLALEQLMSEGYLETRRGRGTYVAVELPDAAPLRVDPPTGKQTRLPRLSPWAHSLIAPTHLPVTTSGTLAAWRTRLHGFSLQTLGSAVMGKLATAVACSAVCRKCDRISAVAIGDRRLSFRNTRSHLLRRKHRHCFRHPAGADSRCAPAARSR